MPMTTTLGPEIPFSEIEKEFQETFGYVRQDIKAIQDLGLSYSIALLVCCACEMLAWHRDLNDGQTYHVFTSLLPDTEPYSVIGKPLWESLRNGLAHKFRPDTIKIEGDEWRIAIRSWTSELCISFTKGDPKNKVPHWIHLYIRTLSSRVISLIDAYEQELLTGTDARRRFYEKSKHFVRTIPPEAARLADAFRSFLET